MRPPRRQGADPHPAARADPQRGPPRGRRRGRPHRHRTDAEAATLLTSDVDERDHEFLTGGRTSEGFYEVRPGIESSIARGKAYAKYADMLWMETATPDLEAAREFAEAIKAEHPDQLLAYNCSPSFNWR